VQGGLTRLDEYLELLRAGMEANYSRLDALLETLEPSDGD
jgi:hypothetical protein